MWGPPLGHGGMELRSTPPKAPKTINSNTSYLQLFIPQKKRKNVDWNFYGKLKNF